MRFKIQFRKIFQLVKSMNRMKNKSYQSISIPFLCQVILFLKFSQKRLNKEIQNLSNQNCKSQVFHVIQRFSLQNWKNCPLQHQKKFTTLYILTVSSKNTTKRDNKSLIMCRDGQRFLQSKIKMNLKNKKEQNFWILSISYKIWQIMATKLLTKKDRMESEKT